MIESCQKLPKRREEKLSLRTVASPALPSHWIRARVVETETASLPRDPNGLTGNEWNHSEFCRLNIQLIEIEIPGFVKDRTQNEIRVNKPAKWKLLAFLKKKQAHQKSNSSKQIHVKKQSSNTFKHTGEHKKSIRAKSDAWQIWFPVVLDIAFYKEAVWGHDHFIRTRIHSEPHLTALDFWASNHPVLLISELQTSSGIPRSEPFHWSI